MTAIHIEAVTKRYGSQAVLSDIGLDLADGSFTALLGPSGCGKTTLLRLIAGFDRPSEGRILFGAETVSTPEAALPPEDRRLGVVFQSYALWPHMSVAENVAYPLKAQRRPSAEIGPAVAAALGQVNLTAFADRRPDALSGGQRQRVALARAIVAETRAILFDEPLANLDVHLRARLVEEFRRIHRETDRTMVYVTHDQAEAIALADRLVVMEAGRVLQVAAPRTVYREPSSPAVARFVGRGAVVPATVEAATGGRALVRLGAAVVDARCLPETAPGPCRLLLRPEALQPAGDGALTVTVRRATYRGPVTEVEADLETGEAVVFDVTGEAAPGDRLTLAVADAWVVPGA